MQYAQKERRNNEPTSILSARDINNIHILALPPHQSHLQQPLDKLFGISKTNFISCAMRQGLSSSIHPSARHMSQLFYNISSWSSYNNIGLCGIV